MRSARGQEPEVFNYSLAALLLNTSLRSRIPSGDSRTYQPETLYADHIPGRPRLV